MNAAERMETAAQSFADKLVALIENRVELALALERDRFDDRVDSLAQEVKWLRRDVEQLRADARAEPGEHSVRVPR